MINENLMKLVLRGKLLKPCFLCFMCVIVSQVNAQKRRDLPILTKVIGLGGDMVINNEISRFKFNVAKNWNYLPFPNKISGEIYHPIGIAGRLSFCYNQYKKGKYVETGLLNKDYAFFSTDTDLLFHFEALKEKKGWADPYVFLGFGYTYRSVIKKKSAITNNLGLGLNFWFDKNFGVGLQSQVKLVLNGTIKSNYLQHSFAFFLRMK
jgi:hypothetical protein